MVKQQQETLASQHQGLMLPYMIDESWRHNFDESNFAEVIQFSKYMYCCWDGGGEDKAQLVMLESKQVV